MSRDSQSGTLVSAGGDKTITTDDYGVSVAEVRRRTWLGLEQGEILGGRFCIQELIQSGGMGDVYRATDLVDQINVAVKTLRGGGMGIRRFEREAQHLSKLRHPGVPHYIYHDLRAEQGPYLVMEWLDGCTLADKLRQQRVGIPNAVALMVRVGEAVAAAQRHGLIHRDINPSNIFLVGSQLDDVRVLDFGVARLTQEEYPLTAEGTQIGTPGYMAPEQVEGSAEVDKSADVFGMGCVLYELVCGQRAFSAPTIRELLTRILTERPDSPVELNHRVQPQLDRFILRCLEKVSRLRPRDAEEFVAELKGLPPHPDNEEESLRPSRVTPSLQQQVTSVIVMRGSDDGLLEKVRQVGQPFGLRVYRGSDSTIVASTQGKGTASDHAATAARCALSLQRATRVSTIAVATGLFQQSGEIPSGRAFDSALISLLLKDRILEGMSGPTLWLDENTASLLDSRFEVRQVEEGFLLRGLRETHEPSRTVLGRRTRCVGRKRELSMLQATVSESFEDGVASSVLITGPPGVGKTRLANELARFARRSRTQLEVLRANGESLTSGSPLAIISQVISRACQIKDEDPHSLRARKLRQRLGRSLADAELTRVAGFFAELLGIETDEFDNSEMRAARRDAVLRGDQIYRALEDWLRAECAHSAILLILDDFQWGDLASVKMCDSLLRNLSESPFVIVCLARPEVHELFPKLWVRRGITELRLGGISRRAATLMIEEILGQNVPEVVVERVIQRAQGNPFWIEELLRAEKAGQGESVPDRVVLLAQSRIEQLSIHERQALEAGSVFGRKFSEAGLAAIVPAEMVGQLQRALRELVESEVLLLRDARMQGTDRNYEFSSALLRDAAYSLIDGDEREEAHCRAAEHLERSGDGEHLAIALHFSLGGAQDRARPHYLGAAEQALSGDDMESAVACAEEGLSCGGAHGYEAARLHLIHAEASKWRGDHATALTSARKAIEMCEADQSIWFRAVAEAAVAAGKLGQRVLAFELSAQLLGSVSALDLDERRIALSRVSTQMSLMGNVALAGELVNAAQVSIGAIEPDPRVLGFLEEARAVYAGATGDPVGRVSYADAGVQYFELAGDLRNACFLRLSQGFAEVEFGDNERALASLSEAVRVAERMGLENSIPVGQAQWGRALARIGRRDEASKVLEQAAATFDRQKNVRLAGMCRIYLAELALTEGDLGLAESLLKRAVGIHENIPAMRQIGHALLAAVYAHQNEVQQALHQAERATEGLTSETRLPVGETIVRMGAAEGFRAAGDLTRARQLVVDERKRLAHLEQQIQDSQLLSGDTESLSGCFLKGCPERAYICSLDVEAWAAHERDYIEFLGQRTAIRTAQHSVQSTSDLCGQTHHELQRILAEPSAERALKAISENYWILSEGFVAVVDTQNASFATFSSWAASGSAGMLEQDELGQFVLSGIRGEDSSWKRASGFARFLIHLLGIRPAVESAVVEVIRQAAAIIVATRRKVHEEIAPLIAEFITKIDAGAGTIEMSEFTGKLRPGSVERGGQDALSHAFTAWFESSQANSPAFKAQLILLGNCWAALHEQTRLERNLRLAVAIPVHQTFNDALNRHVGGWKAGLFGWLITRLTRGLGEELSRSWAKIAARYAMKLSIPMTEAVSLGDESPVRTSQFPLDLRDITETRLLAMSQRFDANFGAGHGASTNEWADLRDRMGYLIELFRQNQQSEVLRRPPSQLNRSAEAIE